MNNTKTSDNIDPTLQFLTNKTISPDFVKNNISTENIIKKQIPIQNRKKMDKKNRELKRKRYNLLLVPSLFEDIKKIAYVEKMSANEAINQALSHYCSEKKKVLEKYAEIEKITEDDNI